MPHRRWRIARDRSERTLARVAVDDAELRNSSRGTPVENQEPLASFAVIDADKRLLDFFVEHAPFGVVLGTTD